MARRSWSASPPREAGRHHRELDHLLLEDRHAQGAFQHRADRLVGVGDRLQPLAPLQVGVDHVALDRPGAHDRDFDHQVVEACAASVAAALPSARAIRSGTRRRCRRARACDRCRDPRPGCRLMRSPRRGRCGSAAKLLRIAVSMPSARMSTFSRPSASMSSLSHWMTVRSAMAAFSTGTSAEMGLRVMTKPPTCCDRWRGKAEDLRAPGVEHARPCCSRRRDSPRRSAARDRRGGPTTTSDLASCSTNSGSSPSALPTSRTALRGR